jgi:hypothetical protein
MLDCSLEVEVAIMKIGMLPTRVFTIEVNFHGA